MAQTPEPGGSEGADGTTSPGTSGPQGLFGSSTTILLIIFAVAVFWWSRRRRVEMEERLRAQRQEAEATAERSALDVANLMRAAPPSGAAAAAAREGLASAARTPSAGTTGPPAGAKIDGASTNEESAPTLAQTPASLDDEAHARAVERAQARAAAERAAEEQAERAARNAGNAGESVARRMAAAEAAAEEAEVDTAEAEHAGPSGAIPDVGVAEVRSASVSGGGMRDRGSAVAAPLGAIAGDGTANCPPDYPIKGNRQSRIYHRPGQSSYTATVAEFCFVSAEAAEAAGYRASRARDQRPQS